MTDEIKPGDRFEDENRNPMRVLSVDNEVVRVEYELPIGDFRDKYGTNHISSPGSEYGLIYRLQEHDESFPAVEKEATSYQSPIRDEVVNEFGVIEPFQLDNEFNLFTVAVGLKHQALSHEPERFPGLPIRGEGKWESGFVVLFEDGQGASFAHSVSEAKEQVNFVRTNLEELGFLE